MKFEIQRAALTDAEQLAVREGFRMHSAELSAPDYEKEHLKWVGVDQSGEMQAVLTANVLWDWMYIDELWVAPPSRGKGVGRQLMLLAEAFGSDHGLQGIWLWTQSWQAEGFYTALGYAEFTRFENFPKGHARIGFRKQLA